MFATVETRDHYVWLPLMFDANTTIYAWQDKAFTMSADLPSILLWQSGSGSHGDFPRNGDVTLRQLRIFVNDFSCEVKEGVNTL